MIVHKLIEHWMITDVLAILDILIMEVRCAKNVILLGFYLYYFKLINSYECTEHANNCISCNTANTFRELAENKCLCSAHYFNKGMSNAVCDVCYYSWLKYNLLI